MDQRRIYGSPAAVEAARNAKRKKADAWAHWVKSILLELEALGFTSNGAIARELNRRGHQTQRGGVWYPARIREVRDRLGLGNPHATGVHKK